jgi:hypothetical protein
MLETLEESRAGSVLLQYAGHSVLKISKVGPHLMHGEKYELLYARGISRGEQCTAMAWAKQVLDCLVVVDPPTAPEAPKPAWGLAFDPETHEPVPPDGGVWGNALIYKPRSSERAEGNYDPGSSFNFECQFCGCRTADVRERRSYDSQDIYMSCAACNTPVSSYDDEGDWQ